MFGSFSLVSPMGVPPKPFKSVVNVCAKELEASAASPSAVDTAPRLMAAQHPATAGERSAEQLQ